ncbi:MAG: flagellar assembly protein FliW [Phycisphaerae bacterium]|nr:flagellar assembly protein FliW [Phycisphaerae bacterium]NUQ45800.1 flagellar assembly protein FliW [Phycisphaerae bacterium]
MIIQTSRFGGVEVDESRLLKFPRGLLGFPNEHEYALIQTGEGSGFYWMQSVTRPELAFVVCDPRLFVSDYAAPVKDEDLAAVEAEAADDTQFFVIVNKVGETLTANLQGPLLVGVSSRTGKQMVLSDKRFNTRHPLMRLPVRRERVSKTA